VLVGLDPQDLDSLALPGRADSAASPEHRLTPIAGRTASNDLSIAVTVQSTQIAHHAAWDFGVQFSWKEASAWEQPPMALTGGTVRISSTLTHAGSLGFSYRAISDESGEAGLPMSLQRVPTDVAGLTVHRIAYATAGGKTRSLLMLVAGSIATLQRCVRAGEDNRFAWTPDWFFPLGVPVLGTGSDPGRPTTAPGSQR
jgi:hypothetical protein